MANIYVGDYGTLIRAFLNSDLTNYTSVVIKINKPDGTVVTKTATVEDEADGIISIQTEEGDIDQAGRYCFMPEVTFPDAFYTGKPLNMTISEACA